VAEDRPGGEWVKKLVDPKPKAGEATRQNPAAKANLGICDAFEEEVRPEAELQSKPRWKKDKR
jgi:hypothetical protein